ncbi:MAG: transcription antitermination factor NusB [Oscillospiraceae bacterium]
MTRHQSRTNAFLLVFQLPSNCEAADGLFHESAEELALELDEFCESILKITLDNLAEIDEAITPNLNKWTLSRLPRVALAVLRISCAQLFYMSELPVSVVINEAVELAKEYGADDDYSFVNGVLRSVADARGLV